MNKKRFIFTLIIAAAILAGIGICVFLCVIAETPWYILLICALVTVVFSNLNFHSYKGDSEENSLMAFKEYCNKREIFCENVCIGTMRSFFEKEKILSHAMLLFYDDKIKVILKKRLHISSYDIFYNDIEKVTLADNVEIILQWQNYKFVVDIILFESDILKFFKEKCKCEQFDDSKMFVQAKERTWTAYEFEYCKKHGAPKKLAKKGWGYWLTDSLLVSPDFDDVFFDQYYKYLKTPYSPDGSNRFDEFGMNYYSKEMTQKIIEQLNEDKPKEYQTLVEWLQKAADQYNGFYFCGI